MGKLLFAVPISLLTGRFCIGPARHAALSLQNPEVSSFLTASNKFQNQHLGGGNRYYFHMRKWLILLFLVSFNSFAQELPEHLEDMLCRSQEYFDVYKEKAPSDIEDGKYDESEFMLFSQVDQVNGLNITFSKEEIKYLKIRMVILISQSFSSEQLVAIAKIGKTKELNKKYAARFFEVALEYKSGILKDILLLSKQLSPKYFNFR